MILLFSANSLFAKADIKLVNEYLKVSGTQKIILALPKRIERGYLKNIKNSSLINIDIKSQFDSKRTIDYIRKELVENYNDELLKRTISFYKSPLGKKYKQNGINSMSEKEIKKRAKFFNLIKNNPPSYDRIKVMNAFVDKLEMTPISVYLIGELLGSINAQLASSENTEKVFDTISNKIRDCLFINSLYAYGDFSSRELKSILEYYYTNAGRFEQLIVSNVFKQLIKESFLEIVDEVHQKTASAH
jgi:hypothetical protein